MESQLAFDSRAKQLNLAFKERFVTDSNFQLKITGNVNTQTGRSPSPLHSPPHMPHPLSQQIMVCLIIPLAVGSVSYQGFLGKFFLAKPRSSSGYALAADKKQLRLGAGKHVLVQCWLYAPSQFNLAERLATLSLCAYSVKLLARWKMAEKQHWGLPAGVHYDSSTEKYQFGVTARKNIQLGSSETWLKLSQDALYDPKTQKVVLCFPLPFML